MLLRSVLIGMFWTTDLIGQHTELEGVTLLGHDHNLGCMLTINDDGIITDLLKAI